MRTITSAVQDTLLEDGFALEALQKGLLNLSAYAKQIHISIEEITMKPVALGTIVVALARLSQTLRRIHEFNPKIEILSINVTSSLFEVTYERTRESSSKLTELKPTMISDNEFLTVTEGLHEITMIASSPYKERIINHFDQKPKVILENLVAVGVRFSEDYIEIPNTIYSLVGALATQHINIMEIVSTYTELIFIVKRSEMEKTLKALDRYSQRH